MQIIGLLSHRVDCRLSEFVELLSCSFLILFLEVESCSEEYRQLRSVIKETNQTNNSVKQES